MTPMWWTRDLWLGDRGEDVRAVQQLVGLPISGVYDLDTASTVRGLQLALALVVPMPGAVCAVTATAMGPRGQDGQAPDWYKDKPLSPGEQVYEVVAHGFGGEAGIRRLQGNYGLHPTGIIDGQTALIMGALGAE